MAPPTPAMAAVLLAALAAPAAAEGAPTLTTPLEPCYATAGTAKDPRAEGVAVRASGFTPNARVDLRIAGRLVPGLQADADGALGAMSRLEVPAPFVRRGTRRFTLTLTEVGNPANTVSARAKSTALDVSVRPRRARPSRRVRFTGSGFRAPRPVYAHYVHYRRNPFTVVGARGELERTVRMERPSGDCGGFRVRRPQIPLREPRLGYWLIQFDQSRRYASPPTTAFHQLLIHVFPDGR